MKAFLFIALMIGAQAASASTELKNLIDLDKAQTAGTGCPAGSDPSVVLRETGRLSLYVSTAKVGVFNDSIDRKTCAMSLPISVPAGKALKISEPSVFGTYKLTSNGSLNASTEAFFAGGEGPKAKKEVEGSTNGARLSYYEREKDSVTSACGQDVILRLNSSIMVRKISGSSAGGSATLDGAGVSVELVDCGE